MPAYSRKYGTLPSQIVATRSGWKRISARADHATGKSHEVMAARKRRQGEMMDPEHIETYRRSMIVTANAQLRGEQTVCPPEMLHVIIEENKHLKAMRTPPAGGKNAKYKKREGAKRVKEFERAQMSVDGVLDSPSATKYRALSARGNFLSQDRVDVSYATKELCRDFSIPNDLSYGKLKRVGRYLVGHHRLVYEFLFQDAPTVIDTYVDTDFAGCSVTRRSTSGGCSMIGTHCVKHWSKTQSTIALSSGEAELGGIAYGTAQTLGLQSLAADLGMKLGINIWTDATAAIGITNRRGLGKIRHLHVSDLWIQEKVQKGLIKVNKILGSENPADVLTKYVDAKTMNAALEKLHLRFHEGRAKSAPGTMGLGKPEA